MPKTSRRSTRRTGIARRAKYSKRTSTGVSKTQSMAESESQIDACDVDFTQGALTEDAELPPSKGGVAIERGRQRRTAKRR
jgi:hypothetical protein